MQILQKAPCFLWALPLAASDLLIEDSRIPARNSLPADLENSYVQQRLLDVIYPSRNPKLGPTLAPRSEARTVAACYCPDRRAVKLRVSWGGGLCVSTQRRPEFLDLRFGLDPSGGRCRVWGACTEEVRKLRHSPALVLQACLAW